MRIASVENVEKLFDSKSSEKVLFNALFIFKWNKTSVKTNIIITICCAMPSVILGLSNDTVLLFKDVVGDIMNVLLALFGVVFTGYAFFQALINRQLLIQLLNAETKRKRDGKKISKLQETNENFVELMMCYIIFIIANLFLKIVVGCINNTFLLYDNIVVSNIIACILLEIYFTNTGIVLWRMISFVYNIFQLFNAHAGAKALAIINEEEE